MKMEKIDLKKLNPLTDNELLLTNGGGLSELTSKIVEGVGYVLGWISAHEIPAHESALLGPNSRPTG